MVTEERRGKPTIDDVARLAGVSKGAVSFTFNDRPGVGEATRSRILAAASALGWHPSTRARALSQSRAFAVGLLLSRPPELLAGDPFFAHILAGVERGLSSHGYALVLQFVEAEHEEAAYRLLAAHGRVDGVLLSDPREEDRRYPLLGELGLPAVIIGDPLWDCPFPFVTIDNRIGMASAVEHLVALGHKRIAHVSGTSVYAHAVMRRRAWRSAVRAASLHPGPSRTGHYTGDGGRKATTRLLGLSPRPTAIVYANDVMAAAGFAAIEEAGLRIPEDISVVGHDDIPLAAHMTPPLTTVRQEVVSLGENAAAALLALITGEPLPPPDIPRPELIVRGSTGPPAQA